MIVTSSLLSELQDKKHLQVHLRSEYITMPEAVQRSERRHPTSSNRKMLATDETLRNSRQVGYGEDASGSGQPRQSSSNVYGSYGHSGYGHGGCCSKKDDDDNLLPLLALGIALAALVAAMAAPASGTGRRRRRRSFGTEDETLDLIHHWVETG